MNNLPTTSQLAETLWPLAFPDDAYEESDIEWIDVDSSTRSVAIAYDEEEELIYVRFPQGEVEWCYEECPPHVWEAFSAGDQSKGQYIAQVLDHKPNHRHE